MELALLANVLPRIVRTLNANPTAWSSNVSGDVGSFPSNDEILAATFEAESLIITRGYFQSINKDLAQAFMVMSAVLAHRANIPFHYGNPGKVEVAHSSAVKTFVDAGVSAGSDTITLTAHGLVTGQNISFLTTGVLPAPLAITTDYFVIVVDANTIKLATSYANALIGTAINITSAAGGGTHTLLPWREGIETKNVAAFLTAMANPNYIPLTDYIHLFALEGGSFYHPATYGRIELPIYTRTAALQVNQSEETLVWATAIRFLTKHSTPVEFDKFIAESERGIQQLVADGQYKEGIS